MAATTTLAAATLMLFLMRSCPTAVRAFRCTAPSFLARHSFAGLQEGSVLVHRRYATENSSEQAMANLYQEWTLEQDQLLWKNRQESVAELASLLGRGLGGVESRLSKLKDKTSSAYERLFSDGKAGKLEDCSETKEKKKLVPASEVLRRIQWDVSLSAQDFSMLHYDRVDDDVIESPLDAPNESISGSSSRLIDALPEHRIVAIKYQEQIVWDREKRVDKVFSNGGIERVMEEYDEWKQRRDATVEWNRQRQIQVSERLQQILGLERFAALKNLSKTLKSNAKDQTNSIKLDVEKYVQRALELFRQVRESPSYSLAPELIPMSDFEALDSLSELVALLPDSQLRPLVLSELSLCMARAEGKKVQVSIGRELPEISEDDLIETFVRGSGPGGQKINKTSNRVVLIHEPTQLRVECQDTRSLPQNRKIARKRMRLKLDEYLNGSQSRASLKAKKASSKKSKAKARSRARQRKKRESKEESSGVYSGDNSMS